MNSKICFPKRSKLYHKTKTEVLKNFCRISLAIPLHGFGRPSLHLYKKGVCKIKLTPILLRKIEKELYKVNFKKE